MSVAVSNSDTMLANRAVHRCQQRTRSFSSQRLAKALHTMAATGRPYAGSKQHKQAYIVLVTGKLAPGHLHDKFMPAFKTLAAYVADNEGGCLAYEISVNEEDQDAFIIYERYTNKEYVESVHWKSDAFKAFQAALRESGVEWLTKQRLQYIEQDVGF